MNFNKITLPKQLFYIVLSYKNVIFNIFAKKIFKEI